MLVAATLSAIGLAFGLWFWWACATPTSTFFRPVLVHGPQDGKRITLTFDDGPAEQFTGQILDILRDHRVPATFFVCGKNVASRPELLRRIVGEGHEVGNHSDTHPYIFFKSRRRIEAEIDRAQATIQNVTGVRPNIFRPPYGSRWFGLIPTLRERGMHLVMWSAAGYDWKKDAAGIIESTLRELKPGAAILLHDGHDVRTPSRVDRSATVLALPAIITEARNRGYTFVPLKDFLPAD